MAVRPPRASSGTLKPSSTARTVEGKGGSVVEADFKTAYIAAVKGFVDLERIARAKQKFAVDVMYGAGRGIIAAIFEELGVDHLEIHGEINPLFPGMNPEPILPHLGGLQEAVVANHCDAGLATDGDADRIGAVAEDGSAGGCAQMLCGAAGMAAQAQAVARGRHPRLQHHRDAGPNCQSLRARTDRAWMGFKYVAEIVLSGKQVLIGGEESGSIGIPRFLIRARWHVERAAAGQRDGRGGKNPGPTGGGLAGKIRPPLLRAARPAPDRRGEAERPATGRRQARHDRPLQSAARGNLDGFKFFLDDPNGGNGAEAWVLLRGSGTEPLLRVYCEAARPKQLAKFWRMPLSPSSSERAPTLELRGLYANAGRNGRSDCLRPTFRESSACPPMSSSICRRLMCAAPT